MYVLPFISDSWDIDTSTQILFSIEHSSLTVEKEDAYGKNTWNNKVNALQSSAYYEYSQQFNNLRLFDPMGMQKFLNIFQGI